jgi:hypothetical protein
MRRSRAAIEDLASDERRAEVAVILAAAVLRLRLRAALPGDVPGGEKSAECGPNCLEVPAVTRLSVHKGLRTEPARETEGRTCN